MLRTFPVRALAAGALAVAAFALVAPSAASAGPRSGMPRVTDHSDSFYGIGCTPTKGCLAVGSWYSSTTKKVYALGETRTKHSSTWVIHDPADIPGATTTGFGPIGNGETVSCVSKPMAVCMGIGSYNDSSYHQHNYAAEWNWSKWKIVKPPDPSPTISSGLDAVKCTSSVFCMAVGHWDNSSTFKFELESEVWNGTSWSLKAMPPTPSGATSPRLGPLVPLSDLVHGGRRLRRGQRSAPLVGDLEWLEVDHAPAAQPVGRRGQCLTRCFLPLDNVLQCSRGLRHPEVRVRRPRRDLERNVVEDRSDTVRREEKVIHALRRFLPVDHVLFDGRRPRR